MFEGVDTIVSAPYFFLGYWWQDKCGTCYNIREGKSEHGTIAGMSAI